MRSVDRSTPHPQAMDSHRPVSVGGAQAHTWAWAPPHSLPGAPSGPDSSHSELSSPPLPDAQGRAHSWMPVGSPSSCFPCTVVQVPRGPDLHSPCSILTRPRERQTSGAVLTAPWTLAGGEKRAFNLFLVVLRLPPLNVFISGSGVGRSPPPHPASSPVSVTGSKGEGGLSFVWLIFINYLDDSRQPRIKREKVGVSWLCLLSAKEVDLAQTACPGQQAGCQGHRGSLFLDPDGSVCNSSCQSQELVSGFCIS